jgi:hypothetical protein
MNYYDNAKELSNASVVDLYVLDELAEKIDYQDPITPVDIINLARLVESFVLSNEVVIRDQEVVIPDAELFDFDFSFTEKWIKEFSDNHVIKFGTECASSVLSNEFVMFDKRASRIARELDDWMQKPKLYFDDEIHNIIPEFNDFEDSTLRVREREIATNIWDTMTSFYGVPFLCEDITKTSHHAKKVTNISFDLYQKIEEYYSDYFKEISKYLGPTYIRIPFLLSLVLNECSSLDDLPSATMYIRDRFSEFNMETTELEYQLRTTKTIYEQAKILKTIEDSYNNIASKYKSNKTRIQSRIFDVVQSFDLKDMASTIIKDVRKIHVEENGLLLIPGYYDIWRAVEDIEQAFPQLKRVFGKQLSDTFFDDFLKSHGK